MAQIYVEMVCPIRKLFALVLQDVESIVPENNNAQNKFMSNSALDF